MAAHLFGVDTPTLLNRNIARRPSEPLKLLPECSQIALPQWRAGGGRRQHADLAHPLRLLRARRQWPHPRTAEQCNELAPFHSITSSARASNVDGTSRPSALAVLRLMTSSYLVGACTGRSAGFSPFRMRST